MENRRAFLKAAAVGVAALGVARPARAAGTAPPPVDGAAAHWLLAPLRVGDALGLGWSLTAVYPPADGALTLNVAHEDGRAARLDLTLLRGPGRGPAQSRFVDVIVMDDQDGAGHTPESLGRVARKLAAVVAGNELRDVDALAALEPQDERTWRHDAAMAVASRQLRPGVG